MSGFSKSWLSLREAADIDARDDALLSHLDLPQSGYLRVIDLGAGTGSNLRYLAPRLSGAQDWTLVDADRALLDAVVGPTHGAALHITLRQLDLMQDLDALHFEQSDLVTASALFDLVSEAWIARLAEKCARANVKYGLFATSVDGRIIWLPREPEDEEMNIVFNAHMRRDKGFGPALGASAPEIAEKCFAAVGYRVFTGDSSWQLASDDAALQSHLLQGYVQAASEQNPNMADRINVWAKRRADHIAHGQSTLFVGHRDVLVRLD